ncbi:subtilase family protein [Chitinophaga niastensis]|uniref:Subtilase family protein n=1 Tax=Chitinophaga niastensis TaxID=536980 RepID=A0A2P8HH82_CHINA|nr:S8/S53 family peptidase [Chitinophaga niastensis]PSL45582.1 subtilase family protein [Chitinophaga niastensis]
MIQLTVTKYLNVRVGEASVNAPCYQYLSPGSLLEVDGALYHGDNLFDNDIWYKDPAGNYYWSGGVAVPLSSAGINKTGIPDWMVNLKIPEIWQLTKGEGVGVAILDTGININNPDLTFDGAIRYAYNKENPATADLQDVVGHGTFCAGLIASKNKNGPVIGVAPDCHLYVCKIADEEELNDQSIYAKAIKFCAGQDDIKVISISWASSITEQTILDELNLEIKNAIDKDKIILCSVGNASSFNDPGPLFPASVDNVIGIGAIPLEHEIYPYINEHLITIINGKGMQSYDRNNAIVVFPPGTSQANAVVAGIVALIISYKKIKFSQQQILEMLKSISQPQTFSLLDFNQQRVSKTLNVLDPNLLLNLFQA